MREYHDEIILQIHADTLTQETYIPQYTVLVLV